jgi:hypothetical protein
MDNLVEVVEELMKEQHKGVMRRLKAGEFDERIFAGNKPSEVDGAAPGESYENGSGADIPLSQPVPETAVSQPEASARHDVSEPVSQDMANDSETLDEAILSFFGIHE